MKQPTEDERRFDDWGRQHGEAVRGYLRAMVRRADLADDLTQEVFCRAWQARRQYREQGRARAYLLRIADRLACDHGRRFRPEVDLNEESWSRIEPASRSEEPPEELSRAESAKQLGKALQCLSPVQRRVLLLRYFGQMRFAEIAEVVGCPLNTVLSHCRRGLQALRKLLVEDAL